MNRKTAPNAPPKHGLFNAVFVSDFYADVFCGVSLLSVFFG
jgi:hypothetical protein